MAGPRARIGMAHLRRTPSEDGKNAQGTGRGIRDGGRAKALDGHRPGPGHHRRASVEDGANTRFIRLPVPAEEVNGREARTAVLKVMSFSAWRLEPAEARAV